MPNLSRSLPVLAILIAGAAPCGSSLRALDDAPAMSLALEEAVDLGLSHNAALAAGRAEAGAAQADLEVSRAAFWPRLLTEAGWHRTDNPVLVFGDKLTAAEFTASDFAIDSLNHPDAVDHGMAAVALEVPLYTAGRVRSEVEASGESRLAAEARVRDAESATVARVTQAYYGVILAAAEVRTAEAALENARKHESVARARFENGAALKSDWLRAQVHRLARQRGLERNEGDLETARSMLRILLGLPEGALPDLAVTELPEPADDLGDLQGWLSGAAEARPGLEAARRVDLAARAQGRAQAAARGPELTATAHYDRNVGGSGGGEGSFFAGVGIRWTAFDRGRSARIDAARAHADAASAASRAAEDSARLEIERAYRDALVSDRNLESARQAVAAAEEARGISADRYASGLLPLTDLLDSETALVEAQQDEIAARYEALVGRVLVERAAGRLAVPR